VGKNDLATQTKQVFENIGLALKAVDATFTDVVKLTYYIVNYKFEYRQTILNVRDKYVSLERPPASTLIGVQALALPDFLIEIEAIAFVE
jgi:enamine deaminase RidA (YjgF/YER057c/UK114 family)